MKTGEGKTLVAVAPIVLNALAGRGSHLVTVNDYLARRDGVWMGAVYDFMGLSVGIIQGQNQESDELGGSYVYEPGADVLGDPRYLNMRPASGVRPTAATSPTARTTSSASTTCATTWRSPRTSSSCAS